MIRDEAVPQRVPMSRLLEATSHATYYGTAPHEVGAICYDSRRVRPGDLFVAIRGTAADGHLYVADAVRAGAVAVVSEEAVEAGSVFNVVVPDSSRALAELASSYYRHPAGELRLFGVTGTNGKTSTAHLFGKIAERSDLGALGVIGTLGHGSGECLEPSIHTTPEPLTLHRLLREFRDQACNGVVMEVSSHAVRQQRTWGLDFEVGMLTNITRDHLDYHSSFEDYVAAKREFCYSLASPERRKPDGVLIYSVDNDHSRTVGEGFTGRKVSVSMEHEADVFASDVRASLNGTSFVLNLFGEERVPVAMQLLGSFSVANATLAAAAAVTVEIAPEIIKAGLESVKRVAGRFDPLGGGDRPTVVVDYSHTPDSLERMLTFCRGLKPRRLIAVFGCGGNRDRGKRPLMGEIAQRLADEVWVTSDNPRGENPDAIIEDILAGMKRGAPGVHIEPDRRSAIRSAVTEAQPGDLVAVCGKGHEDYQIIGDTRHHFDDREEAAKALAVWS